MQSHFLFLLFLIFLGGESLVLICDVKAAEKLSQMILNQIFSSVNYVLIDNITPKCSTILWIKHEFPEFVDNEKQLHKLIMKGAFRAIYGSEAETCNRNWTRHMDKTDISK